MGILSRMQSIMRANVNSRLDRVDHPEKAIDEYMRGLNRDLGQVKAETASLLAEERRAQNAWNECRSEINKLQRYAEKSVETGNEEDALRFLEQKAKLNERLSDLLTASDLVSTKLASMKRLQDKLIADLGELENRRIELKEKASSFQETEEQVTQALYEAEALAELRAEGRGEGVDTGMLQLEQDQFSQTSPAGSVKQESLEDELAAIKAKLNKE